MERLLISKPALQPAILFVVLTLFVSTSANFGCLVQAQAGNAGKQDAKKQDSLKAVRADQAKLAADYQRLEDKLFSLYEFEKSNNPGRSKLLQKALQQSQENMTMGQMDLILRLMSQSQLKDAEGQQERVIGNLKRLLDVLQSEDESKTRHDELKRLKAYIKDVDRLLRTQKGIRGQAEGGVSPEQLTQAESKVAGQTDDLAKEIQRDNQAADRKSDSEDPADAESRPADDSPGEPQAGESDDGSSSSNESPQSSEKSNQGEPGNSETPAGQPANPPAEKSQPGKGEGQSGQPSEGQNEGNPAAEPQDPKQKIQQQVKQARQKMEQAKRDLQNAKRDNAIERMREAEEALQQAKRELEAILRQLREEEIEQALAMLEDRFREMLEKQLRIYESTVTLNKIPMDNRGSQFELDSSKLGENQNQLALDAAKIMLLFEEDGTSVAFPATVEELQGDMLQVAGRLSRAKVNAMTVALEEDILETLNYLVQAVVRTQEDMEKMKSPDAPQQQQASQPGEQPLVDQLAEIKMLKALQTRINKRHGRYASLLKNPGDPVGASGDPEVVSALQRLAKRQADLTEITRDLVDKIGK